MGSYFTAMQNALVNVNGQIIKLGEKPLVSVFDRSYLYGDSLYEVVRTYGRKPFALRDHLDRLMKSGDLCHMELRPHLNTYTREMVRTTEEFFAGPVGSGAAEAYVRLIVSRGEGRIGFGRECLTTPILFTVIVQALQPPTDAQFSTGGRLAIVDRLRNHPRALDPAMKSGNYLNSLLAYLEARAAGNYDDAIFLDHSGFVAEGTTFNLFYVKNGIVVTPPLEVGMLDGITRRRVLQVAREGGLPVREVRFGKAQLYAAEEVFLTSTIKEVFPITTIDQHRIGKGKPGPITQRLLQDFRRGIL